MSELTELEHGQILGARMVSGSVTKVAEVFGVSRGRVSQIFGTYKKPRKTASAKS